jgi:hypothetical protein
MGNFISDNYNLIKKEGPMGAFRNQVFGKDNVATFKPPTLNEGNDVSSTYTPTNVSLNYNPTAYTGKYDAVGGGNQLTNLEKALGVQGFNGDQFRSANAAAIDAQVAKNTQRNRMMNDQMAANSGLGNSGMNRALDQIARSEGDTAALTAKAGLEGQIAGLQQNENQFRTGSALNVAGADLQNKQFGANLTENQAQFGAGKDLEAQQLNQTNQQSAAGLNLTADQINEGRRQYNESAKYGAGADTYAMNEVAPQQRKDQRSGAILQAGSNIGGSMLGLGGSIVGAAAGMCWIAEALYGVSDQRTYKARYAVNVVWPEYKIGRFLRSLYAKYGRQVAAKVKESSILKAAFTPVFALIWRQGEKAMKGAK